MSEFIQELPPIQIFDFIVLILAGWLTLRGVMRGMIAQIASVAAIVVSWGVAVKFSPLLAPMISDSAPTNKLLAMLILFVLTSIVIWFLSGFLNKMVSAIKMKKLDRFLGGTLGLAKGLLLCSLITFFLVVFSDKTRTFALSSYSGRYLAMGIDKLAAIVPEDMSVIVRKNLEGFRDSLKNGILNDDSDPEEWQGDIFGSGNETGNGYFSQSSSSVSPQSPSEPTVNGTIKEMVDKSIDKVKTDFVLSIKDLFSSSTPQVAPSPLQDKVKKTPTETPTQSQPSLPYSQETNSWNFNPTGSTSDNYFSSPSSTPLPPPSQPVTPFRPGR